MEQLQKDHSQAPRATKTEVVLSIVGDELTLAAELAPHATKTEVLVSIVGDDLTLAAKLVSELWNSKVKVEYFVNKRMMKHIDRARESRIPWMVIVGEREMNEGIVVLKDVEAVKDDKIPRSRVVEELKT
nr:histidine--tRNA ligase, cytoplasmic-like [Quercus suber]